MDYFYMATKSIEKQKKSELERKIETLCNNYDKLKELFNYVEITPEQAKNYPYEEFKHKLEYSVFKSQKPDWYKEEIYSSFKRKFDELKDIFGDENLDRLAKAYQRHLRRNYEYGKTLLDEIRDAGIKKQERQVYEIICESIADKFRQDIITRKPYIDALDNFLKSFGHIISVYQTYQEDNKNLNKAIAIHEGYNKCQNSKTIDEAIGYAEVLASTLEKRDPLRDFLESAKDLQENYLSQRGLCINLSDFKEQLKERYEEWLKNEGREAVMRPIFELELD